MSGHLNTAYRLILFISPANVSLTCCWSPEWPVMCQVGC